MANDFTAYNFLIKEINILCLLVTIRFLKQWTCAGLHTTLLNTPGVHRVLAELGCKALCGQQPGFLNFCSWSGIKACRTWVYDRVLITKQNDNVPKQTHGQMKQSIGPKNMFIASQPPDFWQRSQMYPLWKEPLQQTVLENLDSHVRKNETMSASFILCKNQSIVNHSPQ